MTRIFISTLLLFFIEARLARGQSENIIWQKLPIATQQNFYAIKVLDGRGPVAVGDSGVYAMQDSSSDQWHVRSVGQSIKLIGAEDIRWQNQGWKNRLISQDRRFFHLSEDGQWQIDSLPFYPRPFHQVRGLVNLNIIGNSDIRYGIPSDSGFLYCYKFPWPNPQFEFMLNSQKPVNDLFPFNVWNLLAIGDSGKIWKAAGLDNQFLPVLQNFTNKRLNAVAGDGWQKICIAADSGHCLFSSNGGSSWSYRPVPQSKNLFAAIRGAAGRWCVAGEDGLLALTYDDGLNWETFQLAPGFQINALMELDSTLYAAGSGGQIFREQKLNPTHRNKVFDLQIEQHGLNLSVMAGQHQPVSFQFYTVQGRMIESCKYAWQHRLKVASPGLYFLKLTDRAGNSMIRTCRLVQP